MSTEFDLLGDPIPDGFGKRGRPPHLVTDEKRRLVMTLCAFGKREDQIAAALAISEPTLRKHYFRELRAKLEARERVEGKLLASLMGEVDKGNVSAVDRLWKRLDKADMDRGIGAREPKAPKPPKLGKKAQAKVDAAEPPKSGLWSELVKH